MDVHLKSVVFDNYTAPYMSHEFVLGDDMARGLGQLFNDLEGTRTDGHRLTMGPQLAPVPIDFPGPGIVYVLR
jgi:hypothetical protein